MKDESGKRKVEREKWKEKSGKRIVYATWVQN